MDTLLFYESKLLGHQTSAGHPERPARLERTWDRLQKSPLFNHLTRGLVTPISQDEIQQLHSAEMFARLVHLCDHGGGHLDGDTPVSGNSLQAATLAAGIGVSAVDAVVGGKARRAFGLVRPPGHHATPSRSMGFCLFNNIALAARHALVQRELSRILIVDWDVHHGNGTQDAFYEDGRVIFFSAHRFPFYPGTGRADETGSRHGLGCTFNLPVKYGTKAVAYRQAFQNTLEKAAAKRKPQLVLISAGFDAHRQDPIGDLGLDFEDFAALTKMVLDVADVHCQGKVVSMLEGGYHLDVLPRAVEEHLQLLLEYV